LVRLVLASRSPRRSKILSRLGVPFEVVAPMGEVEVEGGPCEDPCALARRNATAKALSVRGHPDSIVVASDTVVWNGGYAYGKPANPDEAYGMLRELSGGWHEVHTAVCAVDTRRGEYVSECEMTRVKFKELTEREIELYLSTGEALDAAGGYAIQGLASLLIERIEGDYYNVVGLPLHRLRAILLLFGVDLLEEAARARRPRPL
jgi:septum formation protein